MSQKVNISDIKVGDRLSRLAYYEVVKTTDKDTIVKNLDGFEFKISNNIVSREMYSSSQFAVTQKINKTDLVEVLEKVGDTIFTVTFHKQNTEKNICDILKNMPDISTAAARKKLAKDLLAGELRTLVGYLVHTEPKMGRSKVVDLNVTTGYNVRLVDHRTIESIISKNVKYTLK